MHDFKFAHTMLLLIAYFTACSSGNRPMGQVTSMFQGDPARSGSYGKASIQNPPTIKWQFKTGGRVYSSAAVDSSLAYFGSEDGRVYALDLADGHLIWSFATGGAVHSSPALAAGLLYLGSNDGWFYALDANSGNLKWKFQTGGERPFSAGGLFGLKPEEEVIADSWDYFLSSPAVADGKVYFGSGDSSVYALDAQSGRLIWQFKTNDVVHSSPALAGNKVYIGSWDSYLYALDSRTGEEIWKFKTGEDPKYHLMTGIQGSPLIADGRVYVGSRDGYLYAVDAETGQPLWSFKAYPSWVVTCPAICDGFLYFGTSDTHRFFALDAATGEQKYDIDVKSNVFSSAAVTDSTVYFGNFSGRLFALDRLTGNIRWTYATEASRKDSYSLLEPDGSLNPKAYENVLTGNDMRAAIERIHALGSILSSPVVCRGLLLFGSTDSSFYALQ